ncbi:MAG: helix-turn-helix domain-containing protein [Aeromonas sp.]
MLEPESPEAYIMRTKQRLRDLLVARGIGQVRLSRMTGIAQSNISRWLSDNNAKFMSLADAVVIAGAIGVPVRDILVDDHSSHSSNSSDTHLQLIRKAAALPTAHLAAMLDCYTTILRHPAD